MIRKNIYGKHRLASAIFKNKVHATTKKRENTNVAMFTVNDEFITKFEIIEHKMNMKNKNNQKKKLLSSFHFVPILTL